MAAFELAVSDAAGLDVAARVGATRVELCSALAVGGVTPSRGFIETAVTRPVPVHVLIRPRAGDFDYSAEEVRLITRDARIAVEAGAAGIVVGGLRGNRVDTDLLHAVADVAGDREITFHRAFDEARSADEALDDLAQADVDRVLTSGGGASAIDGLATLERLAALGRGRVQIMAGGGVTSGTAAIILATGVDALHASAKRQVSASATVLGSAGESVHETVDEAEAFRIASVVAEGRS